ncbi:MAG: Fe-S cluster assembly protein SufD [Candidatus Eremiobacter antarcticus]|nr:Fe-S cluster assembly protein SufD [Candidatus Eremiobacteraeota bacterium]MBC5807858.1 Fe-S cluster assembly protein SufD [Candidatus Eremiobacteraeota bacterium]PZR62770.1 MAG: Fe-S cluster assembly protein SufD [Candidatus Eremiobacter sp. RRmetagenome_bin22]
MSQLVIDTGIDRSLVERLSAGEPAWLQHARLAALERLNAMPQPDDRTVGWRRTALDGLDLSPPMPVGPEYTLTISDADGKQGVRATTLADASLSGDGTLQAMLEHAHIGRSVSRYAALTESAWQAGIFIYIPAGVEVSEPISIELHEGSYPRIALIAGANSQATVVETHREAARLSSGLVDMLVCGGASLRYAHVQECGPSTAVFSHQRAVLERDARLITLNFGIGGRLARNDVEVELQGRGAESEMLGLVFAEGAQEFDYHTLQGHRSPDTRSDLLFKNALDDRSHSSYTGVIVIDRGAQRSDAYQANRNILLSEGARADTEPKLEIEADDVRCTHGATVGPIDEEQLFYASSRGLAPDDAARLIVEGFFQEVFEKFGDARVTEALRGRVSPHLGRIGAGS